MTDINHTFPLLGGVVTGQSSLGSKAAALNDLHRAGFNVPAGFVVSGARVGAEDDPVLGRALQATADLIGPGPFAVRSSAAAEDLAGASYAGLYETFLNVTRDGLEDAVRRCLASASEGRVAAYETGRGHAGATPKDAAMAVLVQQMVPARAAGVAFTANPLTGDRAETVVNAVKGLGEVLVSGEAIGEQWSVREGRATCTGPAAILTADQAGQVAALARRVAVHAGAPQDIEWALDPEGSLFLLQARPMTALPEAADWTAPGPGLWSRNFRLGEWLPDPMTPLFQDWLLPRIEAGFLDGMQADVHARVPFRHATVNGWYYNAPPLPSVRTLAKVVRDSRGHAPWFLYNALVRVSHNPAAAHRAVLSRLETSWRDEILPSYRRLVADAEKDVHTVAPDRLVSIVDAVCQKAGVYLWSLAIVGGSAWKMEAALAKFWRTHLAEALAGTPAAAEGHHTLLRGLTTVDPTPAPHAVYSIDWYHPAAGEAAGAVPQPVPGGRTRDLRERRIAAETAAKSALQDRPALRARFTALLETAQHYAVLREKQSEDLTLGWPVLRRCAQRMGEHLKDKGVIDDPQDLHFLALSEVEGPPAALQEMVAERRRTWQRQRALSAPLTLGRPLRFLGDPVTNMVEQARTSRELPAGAIIGHPASIGQATGPVRVIAGPADFAAFQKGEVLVARSTSPAWTPLFALAAAVVTDSGTLAAHASLVAREYGIPAVVGTGDATSRLSTGQHVTVDGGAGTVLPNS